MDQYRKLTREHAELGPVVGSSTSCGAGRSADAPPRRTCSPIRRCAISPRTRSARRASAWRRSKATCRRCCCRKTRTTSAISSSKSAPAPAATSRRCSRATCCACTLRFAERNRWQVEMMSESESDLGGYKEVIVRIVGQGAYSRLKFESGGHRVQRVPATETQGRIHTSACTVAVMPEADEISDVVINPADIAHRHVSRVGRRRPAHQQDRFRRARDALADRHRRRMPGRPLAAQEQGSRR